MAAFTQEMAEAPPRGRRVDAALSLCVLLVSLTAYLRTMRLSFGWGDPSELVTGAYHLGIGHSPGYPTWMLIAFPFAHLPVGEVAFRVNLMNALLGAIAISLLYLLFRIVAGSRTAAVIAALSFAFSATFWDVTTDADVFTLHVCLAALIVLIALRWRRAPENRWLYLLSWLFGISLGNHALIALMAPALLYLVWTRRDRAAISWKPVIVCLGCLLLGTSVYIYLPVRALANPPPHVNNPHTLLDLFKHISAPGARESMFGESVGVSLYRASVHLLSLSKEFGYAGCVLGFLGLVRLWRRDRHLTIFFGLLAGFTVGYACNFSIFDIYAYYLPLHLVWAAFIAVGAAWALDLSASALAHMRGGTTILTPAWRRGLAATLLLSIPFLLFAANLGPADRSKDAEPERFARAVFRQVEPNAMILADWWMIAPLGYLKYIENQRQDVTMFAAPSVSSDQEFLNLVTQDFLKRYPVVYFAEMLTYRERLLSERAWLVPEGPVSRVYTERPKPDTLLADIQPVPIARFDDQVALVRVEVASGEMRPGECLDVTLYWTRLAGYAGRPLEVIVMLENERIGRIWQEKGLLGHDLYPLEQWHPGQVLREKHQVYFSKAVATDNYDLFVRVRPQDSSTSLNCDHAFPGRHDRDYRIRRIWVDHPHDI